MFNGIRDNPTFHEVITLMLEAMQIGLRNYKSTGDEDVLALTKLIQKNYERYTGNKGLLPEEN